MRKISKKKTIGFSVAALSMVAVVGTWAFYTSSTTINNNLHTLNYADRTIEEFTPDQNIEPGSEITKAVGVENTGDYDLVVRIKMTEKWVRDDSTIISFDSSDSAFKSVVNADPDYTATQGSDTDGLVTGDESVMYKNIDLTNWIEGTDGYWYYNAKLEPGQSTGELLNSLIMATNADMGSYNNAEYYSTTSKDVIDAAQAAYDANPTEATKAALEAAYNWTTVQPTDTSTITFVKSENNIDNNLSGYANADYTLSIITEVCQATTDAVNASWTDGTVPSELLSLLS